MTAGTAFIIFGLVVLIGVALAAGKGRRSKEDIEINSKIVFALSREFPLGGAFIDVKTFGGRVILGGTVHDAEQARRALEIAADVAGVRFVENRITVRSGG